MKITLLEPLNVSKEIIEQMGENVKSLGHEFVAYDTKTTDPNEQIKRVGDSEIVIIANTPFKDEAINSCPNLKYINVAFTGIDHVGLNACKERGITVTNAANYSNVTVAELVIGMTIALFRKMDAADKAVRNGGTSVGLIGREISGKTVGIIGLGKIGAITARIFNAFGAKIIASSPRVNPMVSDLDIQYVTLPELMAKSDIISLHTPNKPSTKGLISREMINLMKPTAIFINCARGPIIDNTALADALNEGRIAGAGIDVYNVEPPIPDSEPLLHAKNTVLAPHVAFLSEEAMVRRAQIVKDNLLSYLKGTPENVCKLD